MDIHKTPLFAESWIVAYRKTTGKLLFEDLETPFILIPNSPRYWAADPFVFEHGEDVYVFAELYDYSKSKGVIGYCRLNDEDPRWTPVIEESFHLSYPFIFCMEQEIFIMPESNESGQVMLYRAVSFPDKWVRDRVLRNNVRYVDTTPFSVGDSRLALTYDLSGSSLVLLDFKDNTDTLIDFPDQDRRRPAGFIDAQEGIRAAQDCAEDYGKAILFYNFNCASRNYTEELLTRVSPKMLRYSGKAYLDGLHTYNRSAQYEVIDIKTRRFNALNFSVRLYKAICRNNRRIFSGHN